MLEFKWKDEPGFYECHLYDDGHEIDDICFWDYTDVGQLERDRERHVRRPYAFKVSWCHGYSLHKGFDPDEQYDEHYDANNRVIGGYQGTVTHTIDDVKKWCENWLAQRYIDGYQSLLASLDNAKRRAEWFTSHGYGNPDGE